VLRAPSPYLKKCGVNRKLFTVAWRLSTEDHMLAERYVDACWNGTGSSVSREASPGWQQLLRRQRHQNILEQPRTQRRCRQAETANCESTSASDNHICHHHQRECHDLRQRYLLLTSVHSFKALSSFSSMCLKHRCIVAKCLNGLSWFLSMRVITEECDSVLVKGPYVERETCPSSELYRHSLHPKSKQVLH